MKLTRYTRPTRTATIAFASAAAGIALAVPGLAVATHTGQDVPAPPANPTSASQIQNIDQVKTAIKGYYGDTVTTTVDPVPNTIDGADVALHTFNPDGAYAHEVEGIATKAGTYLANHHKHTVGKAVLFDIDDTTLNTYNYEIYSNFVYNPTTNAAFVNAAAFPAVPGMVALEQKALAKGYAVFFLTGRPADATTDQTAGTLTNLTNAGYTVDPTHVYLKDKTGATQPWLLSCAPTCTTTQYKSLTRQHIESLGYDIVANFGDQYSDLKGGHADRAFKLPNPNYFLP